MQGDIPSPILFNILFDFIIRRVTDKAAVSGAKFSHGSYDFFHGRNEKHEAFDILALLYADDLDVTCETADDLEKFVRSFRRSDTTIWFDYEHKENLLDITTTTRRRSA